MKAWRRRRNWRLTESRENSGALLVGRVRRTLRVAKLNVGIFLALECCCHYYCYLRPLRQQLVCLRRKLCHYRGKIRLPLRRSLGEFPRLITEHESCVTRGLLCLGGFSSSTAGSNKRRLEVTSNYLELVGSVRLPPTPTTRSDRRRRRWFLLREGVALSGRIEAPSNSWCWRFSRCNQICPNC